MTVAARLRAVAVAVLLLPVHLWRLTAPLRTPRCRFHPSCSTYAVTALQVHGPLRGAWLAARRLGRCHPWNPGGIDPVPPRRAPVPAVHGATDHPIARPVPVTRPVARPSAPPTAARSPR
jgi:putative membrane protein insertion efficiency factor